MLRLSTKSWISAFNAQGSRGIIVAVHVGAVKIYVAASSGGAQGKTKDRVKLRNRQNWWFSEFHPLLNANVLFCRFFFSNLTLCMTKLRVLVLSFPDFYGYSNKLRILHEEVRDISVILCIFLDLVLSLMLQLQCTK
jgi:hypothetical protein